MTPFDRIQCLDLSWSVPPDVGELRVAILGAGKMARLHLEALKSLPGVRLEAICSRSGTSAERLAGEFGIPRSYRDAARLLEETRPDAVFVAVSHAVTLEIASLVLEAGVPCLLEKPAGFRSVQTADLAGLADASHCLNIVGLNRRYYSTIQQALLAVWQQGPVRGVLVEAHEPILEYRSRREFDGELYDRWMVANTIHAIDLLRLIGGEVAEVRGLGQCINEPHGDHFSATVGFVGGAIGTFVAHWNSARGFGLKIYGDGVTAELWPLEQAFLRYDTGRRLKLTPDPVDIRCKPGLYAQDADFLQSVCDRTPAPFPASDLHDNVRTMRLVEAISGVVTVQAVDSPCLGAGAGEPNGSVSQPGRSHELRLS
ncbi:Gfo/Idh/MocA family oxidoreductase [Singulisphaera sp. Ch08]|uniref:Gfo/Idh/MocA family oxidoreductase n=1 Tax=Singulisphaera sp. Ch08 TaxID=3120278 RepID=A0AAU7CPG5_9BACT